MNQKKNPINKRKRKSDQDQNKKNWAKGRKLGLWANSPLVSSLAFDTEEPNLHTGHVQHAPNIIKSKIILSNYEITKFQKGTKEDLGKSSL